MADEKHLLFTMAGDYTDSVLSGETWMMTCRLWADTSVPDDVGTLPNTGSYAADAHSGTGGGGSATTNWKWDVGLAAVVDPVDYLIGVAPACATFINQSWISNLTRLKTLHLYPCGVPDGLAFEHRSATFTYTTPPLGTFTGSMLPPEVSIVVSKRTAAIGKVGRGRVYLPGVGTFALDSHGQVNSSVTTSIATAAAAWFSALGADSILPTGSHIRPAVIGHGSVSTLAPWTRYAVVKTCDVGSVFDAQRRRRRQLVETRASHSISY